MLVLRRRADSSIVIGESIVIKFLEVSGGLVKVGIDAPQEFSIRRGELDARLEREQIQALKDIEAPEGQR